MNRIVEFLEETEPARKLGLLVVGVALLLLGYYVFVLGPRWAHTADLQQQIDAMAEERARKSTAASRLDEYDEEVGTLDERLADAITRLPDEQEIPELLSSISTLGRDSGLDILVFRQRPEGYREFYAEVPVDMEVRGTYHQVASFFDEVGRLDRIVNVTNIEIGNPNVADDDLVLEASSTVTTFRFLSEAERKRLIEEKKIKEGKK